MMSDLLMVTKKADGYVVHLSITLKTCIDIDSLIKTEICAKYSFKFLLFSQNIQFSFLKEIHFS